MQNFAQEKYLSSGLGLGRILLERSHEGHFVLGGLEPTVTHFGAGVDELELDALQSLPFGVNQKRLKLDLKKLKQSKNEHHSIWVYKMSDKKQPWFCYHD